VSNGFCAGVSRTAKPKRGVNPGTLIDLLEWRAAAQADRCALVFLADGERSEQRCSYGELARRARGVAAGITAAGLRGQRLLLLYPPGLDYIAAFWGCLYAGAVAVPAYPPDPTRPGRTMPRLQAIAADAAIGAVLSPAWVRSMAGGLLADAPGLAAIPWLATDELAAADDFAPAPAAPDDLAFLQYTSGSTGTPRGVMLSHGNLLANTELIRDAFAASEDSVAVIWLPPYHDMGLIGGILQPLCTGFPVVLMSPLAFLQRPMRWLEAVARHGGTISGGPNFAFELCVRKSTPEERAALDLRSWRVAFCGAEPIRTATLERFAEAFAPSGFRRAALYPCYGLAEATLIVSGGEVATPPIVRSFEAAALEAGRVAPHAGGRALVSCGRSLGAQRIVIVDPATGAPCPPGQVGEVVVSGASVARGYWGNPEATAAVFAGPGLRTGDLGFLDDGELFVTARLKDIIILRGRNHAPQDLERAIEDCHPALRPGGGAAFAIDVDGEERLAIAHEVDPRRAAAPDEIVAAIRARLARDHDVQAHAVLLLQPGALLKTSSGKVQRRATRAAVQAGRLDGVLTASTLAPARDAQRDAAAALGRVIDPDPEPRLARVVALLARHTGAAPAAIDPRAPITALGLDSLSGMELQAELHAAFGAVVALADLLGGVTAEALARQLERAAGPPSAGATLDDPRDAGLSAGQLGLWFVDQLAPASSPYHVAIAARIVAGDLDALRGALERLVARHPALRTCFPSSGALPIVRVDPPGPLALARIDAAELDDAALAARLAGLAMQPFALASGPLIRAAVVHGARGDVLLLCLHHSIIDLWSMATFARELAALYREAAGGPPAQLPAPRAAYADFVRWQREMLDGADGDAHLRYWRAELDGARTVLALPTDHPRPPAQRFVAAHRWHAIDAGLLGRLEALAVANDATLVAVLVSCFAILLARHTGQDDLIIGVLTTGRTQPAWGDVIGYFAHPIPLRARLAGEPSLREALRRIRGTLLDGLRHQDLPFARMVERLHPARDPSRASLAQVTFAYQRAPFAGDDRFDRFALGQPGARLELGGLTLEAVELPHGGLPFDLSLFATKAEGGLVLRAEYDAALFDPTTIDRLLRGYAAVLRAAVDDPERAIGALALGSDDDRGVLAHWNRTARDYSDGGLVHQLVEAQVDRTPAQIAVTFDDAALDYGALDAQANQLAHHLRACGARCDEPIAVVLERSLDLVVALLAILKAGAAYLPLDPGAPPARVRAMLDGSGAQLVLGHARHAGLIEGCAARAIWLDVERGTIAAQPRTRLHAATPGAALAYVLFTSGSTGAPKGVMVTHDGLRNQLRWLREALAPDPREVYLYKTPYTFDASVWELFLPLICGARVVVAAPDGHRDPSYLAQLIERERVTALQLVPTLLAASLAATDPARWVPRLDRIFCGGEVLPPALLDELWRFARPDAVVMNLYGPTETVIQVATWICRPQDRRDVVPIGRPVANTQCYVLDDAMALVPPGVVGELYVGGAQLARGYLGRPAATAERFVPDPFGPAGGRLYRTGDRVRWRADGALELVGRIDGQVKLRGLRIEVGEIEAMLVEHPAVERAAVFVRAGAAGDELIACWVRRGPPMAIALREHLRVRLPDAMIPAAFVELTALPLTVSGKLDRQALRALALAASPALPATHELPQTPTQQIVCGLWAELLGHARVAPHDSFFELGGHSLLAIQVMTRVRDVFGVELSVRVLFESPTAAALAARIEQARAVVPIPARIASAPRTAPAPLSFAQERMWFLHAFAPGSAAYNLPAVIRLAGALDAGALEAAIADLVARHPALRTTVGVVDDRPVQRIDPEPRFAWASRDVSSDDEVAAIARGDAGRAFDLTTGPLVRATLLRRNVDDHHLVLTLHHFACDAWSLGILFRELGAFYRARRRQLPAALPSLAIDYADFAIWQRRWLADGELARQLGYWRDRLDGVQVLELPCDRPRPAVQSLRGDAVAVELDAELVAALTGLAGGERASLFMVLLAAWSVLLQRYTGQDDVAVGTPVANRHHRELEGLVGLLVNTLVIRNDLSGAPTFREVLRRVRDRCLDAYGHADLPFEKLVEELRPLRDPGRSPLFQVMFALNNVAAPRLELDGLTASARAIDNGTVKFDLGLALDEAGGGLAGAIEYSADLFDRPTIERLHAHFAQLLRDLCARPDRAIFALRLHRDDERDQLLAWGRPTTASPAATAHALIGARVGASPDALAVVSDLGQLTYRALDEHANALAHRLRAAGVRDGDLVGVYLERSLEQIVTVLAVLKAGAGYVPLDPEFSAARLGPVIAERSFALVATRAAHRTDVEHHGARTLDVSNALAGDQRQSRPPASRVAPDDLAYVLYTSGSTGRPKGVMITHRALAGYARCAAARYGVVAGDRHLQLSSLSFDASINEIFVPLVTGGTVVLRDAEMMRSAADFFAGCRRRQITVLELPTAFWHTLVVALGDDAVALPEEVRVVVLGGERVRPDRLAAWHRAVAPAVRLLNGYGPTEATVVATCADLDAGEAGRPGEVSIGRAIATMGAYVLDAQLELVPIGVVGELWLCGEGLARGYLGDPALTASRFRPDPHHLVPGARMYRTGDLCRVRPDGTLEYLGRRDDQVKIRGFRVELGEIEAALRACEGVREALVVLSADGAREPRLIGYVVAPPALAVPAVRAALAARLPAYMVPAAIVVLDRFPLSAAGKVDRRALPVPRRDEAQVRSPRTRIEARMVALWAELLEVDAVDPDDDFFALGGHSLLAMRMMARLGELFEVELPLRALFEAPTPAGLATRVAQAWPGATAALARLADGAEQPVSFAQERLWLEARLAPDATGHHLPGTLHLRGALDVAALERALTALIARHDVLHTRLIERDGRLAQELAPVAALALPCDDLSTLPLDEVEAAAARLIRDDIERPFDLAAPPLLRAHLIRIGDADHRLTITVHHIACDPWSLEILFRELAMLYRADRAGVAAALPALALRYADFAAWQRGLLQGAALAAEVAHWRGTLAGAPVGLELPIRRGEVRAARGRAAAVRRTLDAASASAVHGFARRAAASPFMVFLAAYHALIQRYTGQTDLVVGTTLSERPHAALEGVVGLFVDLLILRTNLAGDPTFRAVVQRTRDTAVTAFAHRELPFQHVIEAVNPARDAHGLPFVQLLFAFHDLTSPRLVLDDGLVATLVEELPGHAAYELLLTVEARPDGSAGLTWMYDAAGFEPAAIERLADHYERLLRAALAAPDRPIARLPLMSDGELATLRALAGGTARFASEDTLADRFAAQARRTPDAVAVELGADQLTYAELDRRVEALARRLVRRGARPEAIVAIGLERSLELVVAILGVLRAGAAYLPLDPAYPADRRAFMLGDARAAMVITSGALRASFAASGLAIIDVADPDDADDDAAVGALELAARADHLAYVIYTSGSTGRPKGVLVSHRHVIRLFDATRAWFAIDARDVWSLFHSSSFDFSVWELWGALLHGGRLVIVPLDTARDPDAFHHLLRTRGVTVLSQTPSAFYELARVDAAGAGALPALRLVIFGGEALEPARLAAWLRVHGDDRPRLINMYGITETTVHVTYRPLTAGDASAAGSPIGQAIPDLRLHILDPRGELVPIGVPGELHVGGAGVARGYLDRPALTAARFVPDPFAERPGARMYRTGDLVRRRAGGELDFLGRIDDQVKIRGFRIELGEVEAALAAHPGVREVAVVVAGERAEDRRLVAHVALHDAELALEALRGAVAERLPPYMVPHAIVRHDVLPRGATGKLDRRALAGHAAPASDEARRSPRSHLEAQLAQIWRELLELEELGMDDDFFALGGHSLMAAQLAARIRAATGVELGLRVVFEAATISRLADQIEARRRDRLAVELPLEPAPPGSALVMSSAQHRLWFLAQLDPESAAYNVPGAVRLRGALRADLLARSLDEVVARHDVLRTAFGARDGRPNATLIATAPVELAVTDLRGVPAAERDTRRAALAAREAARPFDLARPPLVRARLLQLADDDHVLLVTLHHIVADGWSLGVLFREVTAAYEAFARDQTSPLPALPVQYADVARWQQARERGDHFEARLDYWRQALAGAPPQIALPFDRPRPATQRNIGRMIALPLDAAVTRAAKQLARDEHATLYMVLLATFYTVLHRATGADDLVVGTPVANRRHPLTEGLIGFFVNTLPLRCQVRGDQRFVDLVHAVRRATLDAYDHEDVPFERIVDELGLARSLARNPLVQVLFVLQNAPRQALKLAGLQVGHAETALDAVKLDLVIIVDEDGDALTMHWNFDVDLFDEATVRQLHDHYRRALAEVTARPAGLLRDVTLDPQARVAQTRQVEALHASDFGLLGHARPIPIAVSGRGEPEPEPEAE
jgi:amino acid adenylation domain-containing protein